MILQFYVNKIHSWYILCLDIRILYAKLYNFFFVVGNTETGSPRSKCLYSKSIKEKKKKLYKSSSHVNTDHHAVQQISTLAVL